MEFLPVVLGNNWFTALIGRHFIVDILLLAHGTLEFELEEADGQLGRILVR